MRFRPLDATLLSNPLIESGDVALVTDRKQNTYSCFISNRAFTVGSGTKIHAMLKMLQEIVLINLAMRQRLSYKLGKLRRHN